MANVEKETMKTETKELRRAEFQQRLELDMDEATKAILDSAKRLTWANFEVSPSTLDRWIDTTNAALTKLRAARIAHTQMVMS